MIELVLIAYTDEGDEVEDTVLLVAGEVVNYIEEEVIVTADEVVLVTQTREVLIGEGFSTDELQTSSIVGIVPLADS